MGKITGKGLYYFYRSILLDQYTKFVQIFAYNASKIMIRDNLEKLSKMSTKELNSNSKKVRDLKLPIVKLGIDVDKGIKWIKSGERTDDLYYENIKASGARFVDDVVMNPSKESAQKPLYMTHWAGRAVFQLFSYPVAFGNTVVRNTARDIFLSGGTAAPRMMAGYALMLGMTRLIRGVKTNGESLEEDYTFSSALKDLDTMAVGGPLSLVFGYNESRKYGRNIFRAIAENIGGPTFGGAVAEFFVSGRTLGTFVKHMTPYRNVIKRTNPELLFEFDQLIKDIEDSFADKTEAEKQLRRIEDFIKFQEDQAGITKQRRQLKEELREQKVTGGLVEGTEEVPYTKENPADRIDPFTGEPYTAQMEELGFKK